MVPTPLDPFTRRVPIPQPSAPNLLDRPEPGGPGAQTESPCDDFQVWKEQVGHSLRRVSITFRERQCGPNLAWRPDARGLRVSHPKVNDPLRPWGRLEAGSNLRRAYAVADFRSEPRGRARVWKRSHIQVRVSSTDQQSVAINRSPPEERISSMTFPLGCLN